MNKLDKQYTDLLQKEYIFDNKPVDESLPGAELSDIESLNYFFKKYVFSIEQGTPNRNLARILKMWVDIIQDKTNK